MGYVERLRACMFAVILVLGSSLTAYAEESYQPRYQILQEDLENYTVLVEELGEYKVCEGIPYGIFLKNFWEAVRHMNSL